jgi:FdhD protein
MPNNILKKVEYTKIDDGATASERIVRESVLAIKVDGRLYATAMLMATLEKEFVIGNLYVQGVIKSADDIKSLTIKNNVAEVALTGKKKNNAAAPAVKSDLKISAEDIFACVKEILKSEIFTETEAVHSAGLFLEGKKTVCITEDLGRHNALDKVIGYGLMKKIHFGRTVAASTGRQPSEMIIKCRHAGIPIIVTKAVPTTLAVELAEKAGITIAGLVRGNTMIVYAHPERIEGADEKQNHRL